MADSLLPFPERVAFYEDKVPRWSLFLGCRAAGKVKTVQLIDWKEIILCAEGQVLCESEALTVPAFLHFLFFPFPSLFQLRLQKRWDSEHHSRPSPFQEGSRPSASPMFPVRSGLWKPLDFDVLFPSVPFSPEGRHGGFAYGVLIIYC